jgi:lipoyl(octanoyl) transferase
MQLIVRKFADPLLYSPIWEAMSSFTSERHANTPDEIWLLEHFPVFTQGLAGKPEHVLNPNNIPIVHSDRGGQVTYHGPGQLMLYALLDLKRLNIGARELVRRLEQVVMDLLAELSISSERHCNAPGIYIENKKICSIGLRVRKGCCYHGIALNIDMDLTPFQFINPCGFQGLQMTQLRDFNKSDNVSRIQSLIIPHFVSLFGYTEILHDK